MNISDLQLHLFDQMGREVMPLMLKSMSSTGPTRFAEFIIRRGNMSSGVYFWRLSAGTAQLNTGHFAVQ